MTDRQGLVIIPALNESRTIGSVIERVHAADPELDVLVVDDGSRDDTAARARRHGAHVTTHIFNLGYGSAVQTGYKYAAARGYAYVAQMDGDGQHDPAELPSLLAPLRSHTADVVIGSRFIASTGYEMQLGRSLGRVFFQRLLVACGGPRVADPTSGFQALARPVFQFCCGDFFPVDFPDVDVLLTLHRQGFRIVEVPVHMAANPPGHVSMHAGLQALYYPYKMLLATFRAALAPRAPGARRSSATTAASVEESNR